MQLFSLSTTSDISLIYYYWSFNIHILIRILIILFTNAFMDAALSVWLLYIVTANSIRKVHHRGSLSRSPPQVTDVTTAGAVEMLDKWHALAMLAT